MAGELVLVQGLLGGGHHLAAPLAPVAACQLVLTLQVTPHVVRFVSDVLAESAAKLPLGGANRVSRHQVCAQGRLDTLLPGHFRHDCMVLGHVTVQHVPSFEHLVAVLALVASAETVLRLQVGSHVVPFVGRVGGCRGGAEATNEFSVLSPHTVLLHQL